MSRKNGHSYTEQEKIDYVREFLNSSLNQINFAKQAGIDRNTLKRWIDLYKPLAELKQGQLHQGHGVERTTVQYDEEGKIQRQWVKTKQETKDLLTAVDQAIERASESVVRYKPLKAKSDKYYENIAAITGIADAHVGAFACEKTGEPWNLDKAYDYMCYAADYLLEKSPESQVAYIFNVGDYFDYYNQKGTTELSGHVLDISGSPYSMLDVGFEILVYFIQSKLQKHNEVIVDNRSGNHDGLMAHVLNKLAYYAFKDEPRVKVNCDHGSRSYHQYGINLFGLVHGHQTKDAQLPLLMAQEQPQMWADTTERLWFRGHHHHHDVQDYGGVKVEQLRTICPPNRYAKEGGWLNHRELKVLTYHKDYGRDEEFYCSSHRIRSALDDS